jgi:hypothetical protein
MSSNTASNMVESPVLAALRTTDSGSLPRSPARCSLDPCLPRSTGFAPVRSPFDRAQAEGVHADPVQVDPAGRTELVQQHRMELIEHARLGPLVQRRQQVVAEPQPSSLAGSNAQGVEVRAMKMSPATQLRQGRGAERRRVSGVVGLAAAAGCVAPVDRAAACPRDWSWAGASQHRPESLKQPLQAVPKCPLKEFAHYQDHGIPEGDHVGRHGNAQASLAGVSGRRHGSLV